MSMEDVHGGSPYGVSSVSGSQADRPPTGINSPSPARSGDESHSSQESSAPRRCDTDFRGTPAACSTLTATVCLPVPSKRLPLLCEEGPRTGRCPLRDAGGRKCPWRSARSERRCPKGELARATGGVRT